MATMPTRFDKELFEAARAAGALSSRSAAQQLDHWARLGRAVSAHQTAARRRVEAALAGAFPVGELDAEEAVVFSAEVETRIEARLAAGKLGQALNAAGVTTVSLDGEGGLVEHRPDGSSGPLAPA